MSDKIAVIIPTYGQFPYVFRCLESLVRLTAEYRCILLDDGSPDWSEAVRERIARIVPPERLHLERFESNRGLTAAWNRGLQRARELGLPFAALVNSDTLFTPGWLPRTLAALEQVELVGPMSNAPGEHVQQQIQRVWAGYQPDDSPEALAEVSWRLARQFAGRIRPGVINGFWMAARTQSWWANAFDSAHVFNPAHRLTGNETEFQKRFRGRIGTAADVFIFHYRSVSRGLENVAPQFNVGAFRPAPQRPATRSERVAVSGARRIGGGDAAKQRLHIALVCDEFPPAPHGGTGASYRDLAHALAAQGHRVTVVGVYRPEVLSRLGPEADRASVLPSGGCVRVARLGRAPRWLGWQLQMLTDRWRLKRWLARAHRLVPLDLIEASDYGGWLPWGAPGGVAHLIRLRGSNLFFDHELNRPGCVFEHLLERQTVLRAAHLAAVSEYAARRTLDVCGCPARPATVIYNAVDTEVFSPSAQVALQPGLVAFVNSLNPKKGIEQLLDAMNLVCAKHPQARLVVIGPDTQKPEGGRSYLERLRERVRPEFRGRVEFVGRLDRATGVLEYLRRAQLCCLPSHMETFGIAAVEAMAVGKPVICSRTGPGPEILDDGVSGLLCDPFDATDIAEKILRVLEHPAWAQQLGANARARVLQRFDQRGWAERNVAFYRECLGAAPQTTRSAASRL